VNIITTRQFTRATRFLLRVPTNLYDWHAGWLLGNRFLHLTHVRRKSGRRYQTMLEVVGTDKANGELVVVAGFGPCSDWVQNINATPAAEIAIESRRFRPEHRILDQTEAAAVLADNVRRNRLIAPMVRRVLSRLVGWPYDGSPDARRRLVQQLPVIAFRPLRVASAP
jgi:deazaflavin-dependent oxidoreductase (nitroreductase family)